MEWLEDTNMEDIMNAGALRKIQTIGNLADPFQDLEWASESGRQLALGVSGH